MANYSAKIKVLWTISLCTFSLVKYSASWNGCKTQNAFINKSYFKAKINICCFWRSSIQSSEACGRRKKRESPSKLLLHLHDNWWVLYRRFMHLVIISFNVGSSFFANFRRPFRWFCLAFFSFLDGLHW